MLCPECSGPLRGRQELCSQRCRSKRHRTAERQRREAALGYLDAAVADPASAAALARRARAALGV
ncbi:hypothetical protein [Rathayibacter sp. VKM Ac-2803]|uniref:hypothetical protein n=1 Tax=Rathayibacter sp. VKM Ac-2803 TaxID=2609256 RepID=UPI00135CF2AC|nr:hypothetical protein [Rathayibacter sp. VKM Ac-2803]